MSEAPDAQIGVVSPDRFPECLAVVRAAFATDVDEFNITRENTPNHPAFWELRRVEELAARGADLIALSVAGRLLGCAFVLASRSRPTTWELRHLAVLPEARRRGYGERIVGASAERARAAGATVLRIGIVADNLRLAAWYRRLGFVSSGIARYPSLPFSVEHFELTLA